SDVCSSDLAGPLELPAQQRTDVLFDKNPVVKSREIDLTTLVLKRQRFPFPDHTSVQHVLLHRQPGPDHVGVIHFEIMNDIFRLCDVLSSQSHGGTYAQ